MSGTLCSGAVQGTFAQKYKNCEICDFYQMVRKEEGPGTFVVVTSAVREIPAHWSQIKNLYVVVSIDGLQPEHDVRRKPATYDRILKSIRFKRIFTDHAFPGDEVSIRLELENKSLLPAVWLHIREMLSWDMATSKNLHQVISMSPRSRHSVQYSISPRRRGYYPIGPFQFSSGDLLGLSAEKSIEIPADYLTIYPRVYPLTKVKLPSHSPMGSLKHEQPIFEDPSRTIGKRDYKTGDSLRRIDWKATANSGRLQVKQFEPSIALESVIFLNLNVNEYYYKSIYSGSELAISIAASLANWIVSQKQSVGLVTNGKDVLSPIPQIQALPPRKGRAHLMRLLELLARVEVAESESLVSMLHSRRFGLSWGTSLILIANQADDELFSEILQARKGGLDTSLVLCGDIFGLPEAKARANQFNIPLAVLFDEAHGLLGERVRHIFIFPPRRLAPAQAFLGDFGLADMDVRSRLIYIHAGISHGCHDSPPVRVFSKKRRLDEA